MVEYIQSPPDIDGGEGLLAIYLKNIPNNRVQIDKRDAQFFTNPDNILQLGLLKFRPYDVVNPHVHLPRKRTSEQTQEVLFVRRGSATLTIYNGKGETIRLLTITSGDCILLLAGGHSLLCYSDTEIIEVKLGPYTKREEDKKSLNPLGISIPYRSSLSQE